MYTVPTINEFKHGVLDENKSQLINVLHQKFTDNNDPLDLIISFNLPEGGYEPGEVQGIENLSDETEITLNDLGEEDMEAIKLLFAEAVMSYLATQNGLDIEDFPEFEKEGLDYSDGHDPDDYPQDQLAVGVQVQKEHTKYEDAAMEISMDHLDQNKEYYTELIKSGLVDEKTAIALAKQLGIVTDEEADMYEILINESEGPNTEIFITDLGISPVVQQTDGPQFTIPRFGIWSIKPNQKPNVIETSDNLEGLLSKYKLTESDVIKLIKQQ